MAGVSAFVWQAALLLLVAYFLGTWIGCWLRRALSPPPKVAMETDMTATGAGRRALASGALAAGASGAGDRFARALEGDPTANASTPAPRAQTTAPEAQIAENTPQAAAPPQPTIAKLQRLTTATDHAQHQQPAERPATHPSRSAVPPGPAPPISQSPPADPSPPPARTLPPRVTRPGPAEPSPSNTPAADVQRNLEQRRHAPGPQPASSSQPPSPAAPPRPPEQASRSPLTPPLTAAAAAAAALAARQALALSNKPDTTPERRSTTDDQPIPAPSVAARMERLAPASVAAEDKSTSNASPAPPPAAASSGLQPVSATRGPATLAAPAAAKGVAATDDKTPDDLTLIAGVSPRDAETLKGAGVVEFAAIAGWTAGDVARTEALMGGERRIARENWIEQAQLLKEGRDTAFSRRRPAPLATRPPAPVETRAASSAAPPTRAAATKPAVSQRAAFARSRSRHREDLKQVDDATATSTTVATAAAAAVASNPATPPPAPRNVTSPNPPVPATPVVTPRPTPPPPSPVASPTGNITALNPPGPSPVRGLRSVRSEALVGGRATGLDTGRGNDLKRIRGVGVLIEKRLRQMGYDSYDKIASWTQSDIDRVSQKLDFHGRIERENWIEQARILAAGGQTDFSRRQEREE